MIALETDSVPSLAPFWDPKSDQIGPKRAPNPIQARFLLDFGTLLGPIWSDLGSQNGAKIGPESVPRAIMKQIQKSLESFGFTMFLSIRGPRNRSKIALKTMLS